MKGLRYIVITGIFLIACTSGGAISTQPGPDAYAPDSSLLMDAQILEKLSPDTVVDNYWYTDSGADTVTGMDIANIRPDAMSMDNGAISDTGPDAMSTDTATPEGLDSPCGGCADGYSCQNNECVFAARCDTRGLTDLNSLSPMMAGGFIKLKGLIRIGKPTCGSQECSKDNPCCQHCFASLKLGTITLKGDGISLGCLGTNCDFQKKCTPLTPDQAYIVWGKLSVSGFELELQVQGFCAAN